MAFTIRSTISKPHRTIRLIHRSSWAIPLVGFACLFSLGCGNSAKEQEAADALKAMGAIVSSDANTNAPARSVMLSVGDAKDNLDEAMPLVQHLSKMDYLQLVGTDATDAHMEYVKGLSNLKGLNLNETKVTDAGVAKLTGLSSLVKFELGGCDVTEASLDSIRQMKSIDTLNLSNTKIKGDLAPLTQMPNLVFVMLIGMNVSDEAMANLAKIEKLTRVSLNDATYSESALAAFKKAKPGVSIDM